MAEEICKFFMANKDKSDNEMVALILIKFKGIDKQLVPILVIATRIAIAEIKNVVGVL